MTSTTPPSLSPRPYSPPKNKHGLSESRFGLGVPSPIPVLAPSEGGNTTPGDPQTLRTPVPLVPSSFFVGVPSMLGGESHPQSAVDIDAVTEHIESHSSEFLLQSPPRVLRSRHPPPPPPTPRDPIVSESPYHTNTVPCTREANPDEISTILQAPSRLLGHKFTPSHGQEIWEAVEVSVGTTRAKADGTTAEDDHRPAVPLRLQTTDMINSKQHDRPTLPKWKQEANVVKDAFADKEGEEGKPVPQLVGTGEVAVRFRGYEGSGEEHYMLVRDFVDMLKDRSVLIVELE
ncbi:hypothetical protein CVT24_006966 [Panaeolus cyanescens]|uniref:Uncharacterized protein n=1 Tax=Panaeolus cyanescens TaxID=181874 RepID=A0A409YX23_9AGAR|nr:hypothetical protein CVT24_006966 [Panaeolus cyanescens]